MRIWILVLAISSGCGGRAPDGPITLQVPGALRISAHCGGDDTVHQRGDTAEFVPQGPRCEIEAPLSPVMPLYGQLELTSARSYRCERAGMELRCAPSH